MHLCHLVLDAMLQKIAAVPQRRRARSLLALELWLTATQSRAQLVSQPLVLSHARGPLQATPLATLALRGKQRYVEHLPVPTEMPVAHVRHRVYAKYGQMWRRALYSGVRWTFTEFQLLGQVPFQSLDCMI